jgi:hypothetical protein
VLLPFMDIHYVLCIIPIDESLNLISTTLSPKLYSQALKIKNKP